MKWISKAIVITTFLWLTGSIGSALAQESPCEPIDLGSTNYDKVYVARDTDETKDAALLCEEMSLEELEFIAGKGPGDKDRPYLTARIVLGDEIDVDQASGVAFHSGGGSPLNVQMNSLVVGTR